MSIHSRIKTLREQLGWSMEELARAISKKEGRTEGQEMSWQTVQQWENGKTQPSGRRRPIVAEVLGTTEADLLGIAPTPAQAGEHSFMLEPGEPEMLLDFRDLEETERERIRNEIHSLAERAREHAAKLLRKYGATGFATDQRVSQFISPAPSSSEYERMKTTPVVPQRKPRKRSA